MDGHGMHGVSGLTMEGCAGQHTKRHAAPAAHQIASASIAHTNTSQERMRPMQRRGEEQPSPLRATEGSR